MSNGPQRQADALRMKASDAGISMTMGPAENSRPREHCWLCLMFHMAGPPRYMPAMRARSAQELLISPISAGRSAATRRSPRSCGHSRVLLDCQSRRRPCRRHDQPTICRAHSWMSVDGVASDSRTSGPHKLLESWTISAIATPPCRHGYKATAAVFGRATKTPAAKPGVLLSKVRPQPEASGARRRRRPAQETGQSMPRWRAGERRRWRKQGSPTAASPSSCRSS